jgi:hypothetical protein
MRNALWAAVLVAAGALVSFRSTYEPDLWWHLAQGREAAAGHLVRANVFSADFAGYRQHYTSWLFDLGGYLLWTRVGPAAIQAAQALLLAVTLGVVAAACRVRSSVAAAIAVCAIGWVVLEPRALPRPYLFSFVAIALCSLLIEHSRAARSWRPLWWAPLAIAAWANVHVECVFGVAFIALFGAGEWLRPRDLARRDSVKVLFIAAAGLAATVLNPYGIGLLRYLYENTFVPQVIDIAELHAPYLPNYRGFFAWTIAIGALGAWRWRLVTLADAFAIALFAVMGFRFLRLTPLLFLVSAPLVARCLDDVVRAAARRRAAAAVAVVAALLLIRVPVIELVRGVRVGGDALEPRGLFSPPAMQFARDRGLTGPAFTSINLGGYVTWHLYPSARPFIDARLQAYPPEFFRAIRTASSDPAAWAALTRNVDWAVLSVPRVNEWSGVGRFNPDDWGSVYRDDAIEILVRRGGRYRALITSF